MSLPTKNAPLPAPPAPTLGDEELRPLLAKQPLEPLIEAITILGPKPPNIATRLGVSTTTVERWASGAARIPARRRKQLQALAVEALEHAVTATEDLVRRNPKTQHSATYARWWSRLHRARTLLLREFGR
jgi:DNA-binding transcriptional regulator YdaS (Cro superfamily)